MEMFKPVIENPNYGISNLGNFKNLKTNKIHKPRMGWGKYLSVFFIINGKRTHRSVHQLVAKAFIPNPENKPCVNHKKGNKFDNRASELEWVTYSENNQHAYDTGLKTYRPLHYKGKFGYDHNRSKEVFQYTEKQILISKFGSASEASRKTGIGVSEISKSACRRYATAGGFLWSHKELTEKTFPKKPANHLIKKVNMLNSEGVIVRTFNSFKEAALFVDCHPSCISDSVHGKSKQIKGYRWANAI